jgi:3-deoxy-7-phosphoheptulonate synthase
LDLTAVPVLKERTHLPVIVDPSHAAGRRELVEPLSLAAAAVGADGIMVEVHPHPDNAVCDGRQSLHTADFAQFAHRVSTAAALAGNELARPRIEVAAVA